MTRDCIKSLILQIVHQLGQCDGVTLGQHPDLRRFVHHLSQAVEELLRERKISEMLFLCPRTKQYRAEYVLVGQGFSFDGSRDTSRSTPRSNMGTGLLTSATRAMLSDTASLVGVSSTDGNSVSVESLVVSQV